MADNRHFYSDWQVYRQLLDERFPAPEPDGTLECLNRRCDHFRWIDATAIRLSLCARLETRTRITKARRA